MATLISANGGGNWTTLATWRSLCAGTTIQTQTAYGGGVSSTVYTGVGWSTAMTINTGEVIEGVGLYLLSNGTTGTVTVALSDDGGTTATREVTVNSSDLPRFTSWVFFAFGSTLTADGGSDYRVSVKNSSGGSTVSLSRSSTAYDFARFVRSSSAPSSLAAGDVFYIVDDLTAGGAKTANTVTMDCLASAVTDLGEINIGLGTVNCGVTAATNYYLKASGNFNVWGGGNFNVGSVGSPLPADSTAIFELDPTSDGEFGFNFKDGSYATVQGYPMTKVWTLLNANASANATSLTTADATGWKDNDQIAIASTSRTPGETEAGALNGNASGTTLTVDGFGGTSGGITYAHTGTTGFQAEIINLTRNVKFRSSSSTVMAYIYVAATATVDFDYAEMYYLGENVAGKRGIEIATTTGSCSIQYCSLHDTEDWGLYLVSASGSNIAVDYNVFYNLNTVKTANLRGVLVTATSGVTSMTNNVFLAVQSANQSHSIYLSDSGINFSNNRLAGFTEGSGSCAVIYGEAAVLGTCSNNVSHSHDGYGWGYGASFIPGGAPCENLYVWFVAGTYGLYTPQSCYEEIVINNSTFIGTGTTSSVLGYGKLTFNNCTFDSHATYTSSYGVTLGNVSAILRLNNCTIGGITAFVSGGMTVVGLSRTYLYNTTIANSIEVAGAVSLTTDGFVRSHKHDASGTTYKNWFKNGTVNSDQTTRHTASGYSWNLAPTSASQKLIFPGPSIFDTFKAAVVASAAVTITAWVRKDSFYNGNAPRLVLVGGYIGGIAAGVVDSLSVGADTWEQLSVSGTPNEAGVIEWYVDCDGTAGSIYVDDMAVSQSGLPSADNLDYASWGLPLLSPYTLGAAASGGLMTHPGMSGGMRG